MEAPQHILEAPESQRKRMRAEISADADQGSVADISVGDVGDGDVVTLRPQISRKKWWQGIVPSHRLPDLSRRFARSA